AHLGRDADAEARLLERDADRLESTPVGSAEQVLHERVDIALPAVDDLQPVEPPALGELARERFREARHPVELVAVLADQAVNHAARDGQREAGEGRGERLRRVSAQVSHAAILPLEAEDPSLTPDLDLHLGLADVEHVDAVEAVALEDE